MQWVVVGILKYKCFIWIQAKLYCNHYRQVVSTAINWLGAAGTRVPSTPPSRGRGAAKPATIRVIPLPDLLRPLAHRSRLLRVQSRLLRDQSRQPPLQSRQPPLQSRQLPLKSRLLPLQSRQPPLQSRHGLLWLQLWPKRARLTRPLRPWPHDRRSHCDLQPFPPPRLAHNHVCAYGFILVSYICVHH